MVSYKSTTDLVERYKRVRKGWGDITPYTKVKESKKRYNRKKENKKWRKEVNASI